MTQALEHPDPNERGRKARAASRAATKLLSETQFRKAARISAGAVDTLHEISRGKVGRNSATVVKASQTLIDAAYPKIPQQHELSGNVTIRVESPLMGAPGSMRALPSVVDSQLETPREEKNAVPSTANATLTADQRRAAEREAWLADVAIHPPDTVTMDDAPQDDDVTT